MAQRSAMRLALVAVASTALFWFAAFHFGRSVRSDLGAMAHSDSIRARQIGVEDSLRLEIRLARQDVASRAGARVDSLIVLRLVSLAQDVDSLRSAVRSNAAASRRHAREIAQIDSAMVVHARAIRAAASPHSFGPAP